MTSDERREAAERLRWLASKQGTYKGVLGSDVLVPLRLLSVDYPGFMPRESVARLADLIDPTCEAIEHGRPDKSHVCKSCSKCSYGWFEDINDKPYSFCPNCGSRVVRPNGD